MAPLIKNWAPALCGVLALTGSAYGRVRVEDLQTDLTILVHNDLYGAGSTRSDGVIMLSAKKTRKEAKEACEALGEKLWNPTEENKGQDFLSYLNFPGRNGSSNRYWVHGKNDERDLCRTINGKGIFEEIDCKLGRSALCTDTAPFTGPEGADNSQQYRTTVKTGDQRITGFRDKVSFRFQGVRYADKPERFTYPNMHQGNGTVQALDYSPSCYSPLCAFMGNCSEDCLFLNIYTPFLPFDGKCKQKLRPVLLYIHGGAFVIGTGGDPLYDGSQMASRGDVVVVTINYRLGPLGFMTLDDNKTKGNFAIADQIAALDWIRQHIQDFGGDPTKITISGQSAGGASVRALAQSPKAAGKFAAGISMSNLGGLNYATTYSHYFTLAEHNEQISKPLLNEVGCGNAADKLACLRAIDPMVLATLPDHLTARYIVVDNDIIVHQELPLDGTGNVAKVPMIMGYMQDDGPAFIGYPETTDVEAELWKVNFNGTLIVNSGLFPTPSGPNATWNVFNVTGRVTTDAEFRCLDGATAYAADKNSVFPAVYHYDWARTYQITGYNPNPPTCEAPKTAEMPDGDPTLPHFRCHCGELHYIFGNLVQNGRPIRDQIDIPFSQFSLDTWTSFVRTHNPNPDSEFLTARGYTNTTNIISTYGEWAPFNWENPQVRKMDYPPRTITIEDQPQCNLFDLPLSYYL
ncbi:hypothetical protein FQN57_006326 [Myotisia sp. PD_48]|nr:hypothetical protein FQN57_006326 [Myotisia sp. PD_48]